MKRNLQKILKNFLPNYKKELSEEQLRTLDNKLTSDDIRSYLKSDNFNQLSIDDKLMFIRLIDCIPTNTENKKSNCKGYVQYSTIIDDMGLPQNYQQPQYYHHPAIDNVK